MKGYRAVAAATLLLFLSSFSFANVITLTGSLSDANATVLSPFLVPAGGSEVTIQSWGFGGGVNAVATPIPAGGFVPDISVFDPAGALIADSNFSYSCPPGNLDPFDGCGDPSLMLSNLAAGVYTLGISATPNFPLGPTLSDGFCAGVFPGSGCDGSFVGSNGDMRTPAYAVDVTVIVPISAPEPTPLALLGVSFLFLKAFHRRLS